jgi:RNA polymerase sigma-70 factor (ECF subfamily)
MPAGTSPAVPEFNQSTPPRSRTDESLIVECAAGSEEALALLMGRYKDRLMNYVYRIVMDRDRAADVVQETFIRMYRNAATYRPVAKFSTWLYTIATNQAKSELRRSKHTVQRSWQEEPAEGGGRRSPEPVDAAPAPDEVAGGSVVGDAILAALGRLPAKYREAVVLFDIEELTYEEICKVTGARMGTVKSRLNRGRALLKELLRVYLE